MPINPAWFDYLSQMFGQGFNPADLPSANAQNASITIGAPNDNWVIPGAKLPDITQGGATPPVPLSSPDYLRNAQTPTDSGPIAVTAAAPAAPDQFQTGGPELAAALANAGRPPRPGYFRSTGAGSGDPRAVDAAMNQMTGMAPGVVNPGYQPPGIVPGRVNPNVAAPNAAPVSASAPVKGPLAAPSNNRFVQFDRPNMDPAGGARWQGAPQMTMLNLAGLFGGGGQAPANPANVASPAAQPVSAVKGPLARRNVTTKAPWDYGPLQKGRSWPQGPDWDTWNAAHQPHQAGGY